MIVYVLGSGSFDRIHDGVVSAEYRFGVTLQLLFKDCGIHLTEIGVGLQIAVFQIRQTWVFTHKARSYLRACKEDWAGGPMVVTDLHFGCMISAMSLFELH